MHNSHCSMQCAWCGKEFLGDEPIALQIMVQRCVGEIFGWQAEYTPESDKKLEGSNMTFTPADFWIGESGIWFFSLMWEHGKDKEPVEFLDDRGIIK